MGKTLRDEAETTRDKNRAPGCPTSPVAPTLFPNLRPQRRKRPPVTKKLAELIGDRKKYIATLLRPNASVDVAESALNHAIAGTGKKRIGVDEIDTILDELGPDAEAAFMDWFCLRRGWKPPERMTTREWALQVLDEIRADDKRQARREAEKHELLEQVRAILTEETR